MTANIWFLDVGQGHSTLATSAGHAMVIDCPTSGVDRVLELLSRDNASIDAIVVTHRDLDHRAGIPKLIEQGSPRMVYINAAWAIPATGDKGAMVRSVLRSLISAAELLGTEMNHMRRGDNGAVGEVASQVLSPTYETVLKSSLSGETNRSSIVIRLTHLKCRALVTGDIDGPAIKGLIDSGEDLSADVVLLPHHGAAVSRLKDLLDAVAPNIGIVSAGREAGIHPAPSTIQLLKVRGCRVMCTQVNKTCHSGSLAQSHCAGTIRITLDRSGCTVDPTASNHQRRIDVFASPLCR